MKAAYKIVVSKKKPIKPQKTPEIFPKRKGRELYRKKKKLSYTSKFKKLFWSNGYLHIKPDVNIYS